MAAGEWDESKHPRVPAGQGEASGEFTAGGGGEGVEGARASLHEMFARIGEPDGGFTYQPRVHTEPKTGYAVSIYPERSFARHVGEINLGHVTAYMRKNVDLLRRHDHYLGLWREPKLGGKVFIDVSVVKGNELEARRLAVKHDQKAYFDLRKGVSVYVNPSARSGGAAD